jgi:phosphate transport system protein
LTVPREHYLQQLNHLDDQVCELGELVAITIGRCIDALQGLDAGEAQRLIDADAEIDARRHAAEDEAVVLIATQQPTAGDVRLLTGILIIVSELERIGDYCEGIAKLTLRMAAEPVHAPLRDLNAMAELTQSLLRRALKAHRERDVEQAATVWLEDDRVDELYAQVFRRMILEMTTDRSSIRLGTYLLWVAHNIERMADRVTNIAERTAFVVNGDVADFRDRLRGQTMPA